MAVFGSGSDGTRNVGCCARIVLNGLPLALNREGSTVTKSSKTKATKATLPLLTGFALFAGPAALAQQPQSQAPPIELPPLTITAPKAQATTLERAPVAKPATAAAPIAPTPTTTAPAARPAASRPAASAKQAAPSAAPAVVAPVPAAVPAPVQEVLASSPAIATSDNGTSATIVTARDIETQQIRTVPDALRSLPGVSVNRSGNSGGLTQVRLRGAEANHTLVLIDGIQANTSADGEFDFSNLPAEDIERIEVVRGPMSGLYGTGAIGGVVSITTKKGRGPATLTLRTEVGSFATRDVSVRAQGGNDTAHLSVSGHFKQSDGFNITPRDVSTTGEKDGFRVGSFALNGGVKLAPNASLDLTLRHTNKFAHRDGFEFFGLGTATDDPSTLRSSVWLAGLAFKLDSLDGRLTHEVRIDHNSTRNTDNDRGPFGSFDTINDSRRLTAGYAATYRLDTPSIWGKHAFTGLVQTETERFTPLSDFEDRIERRRERLSFAGEWRGTFANQFDLTAGARRDNNDVFDDFTTWRTSAAWRIPGQVLGAGIRPHASIGTAVKMPSMFEQFGSFPSFFIPNPNLKPEESRGFDAGVEFSWLAGKAVLDVTYFRTVLTNKIAVAGFPSEPFNSAGEYTRDGVEVASRFLITPAISLGLAYTYTDARDADGLREFRRPPHAGRIDLATQFASGKGTFNIAAIYNGSTPDRTFCAGLTCPPERVNLDAAWVVSVAATYKLQPNIELFGRVENALDTRYQEIYGYNTPGVAAFAGVKVTFGP
jgi:vitamin B12 transporter